MDYNTSREKLRLREYGRHIQNMIEYAVSIKDLNERQKVVEAIIHIMGSLNPHLKNVDDFNHLLWDHLHIMADFKLNVASPYDMPEKEKLYAKPKKFAYPKKNRKHRHYGKNIQSMIENAVATEDAEKKEGYTKCIANYMKKVHSNWNSKNVTDEIILNDLEVISSGRLSLGDETTLARVQSNRYKNNRNKNNRNKGGKSNNRNKNYSNKNR